MLQILTEIAAKNRALGVGRGIVSEAAVLNQALKQAGCGAEVQMRMDGEGLPFKTDGGNYILDAHAKRIAHPEGLADAIKRIVGVVDHGLFIGIARTEILGKAKGVEIREA